ncbi:unnamed protein product [Rotaria socialis]|uniref:Uncharacterized protein n=1 Tax=Rotaria socialis TaxID=392032 RepID=A0A817WMW9_9BILA|nr:unnamed protein product [Rotaria socialis]
MLRFSLLAIHRPCLVNTLVRRTLFGRSSSTEKIKDDFDGEIIEQPDSIPQSAIPTISELASYKTKNYVTRLVTCRPYTPPSNVEQIISRIANETIDNFKEGTRSNDNWKSIYLKNPLNAVRFTPETSTFFNELDAFPKRSTKIIDLWYKKKYASYPKNEEDPFKDNIY